MTIRGFLSHEAVLPHMAAVITHVGMSTVATSVAAGVPMVCVPQGRDQPLNAASVEELGAGLPVPPDAPPEELATAVRTVLVEGRFRAAAQRLATSAAAVGNGELATDLVQAVADTVTAPR